MQRLHWWRAERDPRGSGRSVWEFVKPCLALGLVGLLPTGAFAQYAGASSESHVQTAQNTSGGGGEATSTNFVAESELGHTASTDVVQSSNFRFAGGAVWTDGPLSVPNFVPVVFGVSGGHGDHDGGEVEKVFGFNFDVPSGSTSILRFDGVAGVGTALVGNTVLVTQTPAGNVALTGNPKGLVDVQVANVWGSSTAPSAYAYTPILTTEETPVIGCPWTFDYIAAPNSLYGFALGKAVPGLTVPLPPFDGSLELILNVVQLAGATFSPTGFASFTLFIPPAPELVGFPVQIQALAIETLFPDVTGAWSNRLVSVIE